MALVYNSGKYICRFIRIYLFMSVLITIYIYLSIYLSSFPKYSVFLSWFIGIFNLHLIPTVFNECARWNVCLNCFPSSSHYLRIIRRFLLSFQVALLSTQTASDSRAKWTDWYTNLDTTSVFGMSITAYQKSNAMIRAWRTNPRSSWVIFARIQRQQLRTHIVVTLIGQSKLVA